MKRYYVFLIVLFVINITSIAQNAYVIVDKYEKTQDNKLLIEYHIANGKPTDLYNINVHVYIKRLEQKLFSVIGDYKNLNGFNNSGKIYWDLLKDINEFPKISDVNVRIDIVETTNKQQQQQKVIQRDKFTLGFSGSLGLCSLHDEIIAQDFNKRFPSTSGTVLNFGINIAYSYVGIDLSRTLRTLPYTDVGISINSYNAAFEIYTDMPASPKSPFLLMVGLGVGNYTINYIDKDDNKFTLNKNIIGYYPKIGLMCISHHTKLSATYIYNFTPTKISEINFGIQFGF